MARIDRGRERRTRGEEDPRRRLWVALAAGGGVLLLAAVIAAFVLPEKPASAIWTGLAWICGVVTVLNVVAYADDFGPYRRRPAGSRAARGVRRARNARQGAAPPSASP